MSESRFAFHTISSNSAVIIGIMVVALIGYLLVFYDDKAPGTGASAFSLFAVIIGAGVVIGLLGHERQTYEVSPTAIAVHIEPAGFYAVLAHRRHRHVPYGEIERIETTSSIKNGTGTLAIHVRGAQPIVMGSSSSATSQANFGRLLEALRANAPQLFGHVTTRSLVDAQQSSEVEIFQSRPGSAGVETFHLQTVDFDPSILHVARRYGWLAIPILALLFIFGGAAGAILGMVLSVLLAVAPVALVITAIYVAVWRRRSAVYELGSDWLTIRHDPPRPDDGQFPLAQIFEVRVTANAFAHIRLVDGTVRVISPFPFGQPLDTFRMFIAVLKRRQDIRVVG